MTQTEHKGVNQFKFLDYFELNNLDRKFKQNFPAQHPYSLNSVDLLPNNYIDLSDLSGVTEQYFLAVLESWAGIKIKGVNVSQKSGTPSNLNYFRRVIQAHLEINEVSIEDSTIIPELPSIRSDWKISGINMDSRKLNTCSDSLKKFDIDLEILSLSGDTNLSESAKQLITNNLSHLIHAEGSEAFTLVSKQAPHNLKNYKITINDRPSVIEQFRILRHFPMLQRLEINIEEDIPLNSEDLEQIRALLIDALPINSLGIGINNVGEKLSQSTRNILSDLIKSCSQHLEQLGINTNSELQLDPPLEANSLLKLKYFNFSTGNTLHSIACIPSILTATPNLEMVNVYISTHAVDTLSALERDRIVNEIKSHPVRSIKHVSMPSLEDPYSAALKQIIHPTNHPRDIYQMPAIHPSAGLELNFTKNDSVTSKLSWMKENALPLEKVHAMEITRSSNQSFDSKTYVALVSALPQLTSLSLNLPLPVFEFDTSSIPSNKVTMLNLEIRKSSSSVLINLLKAHPNTKQLTVNVWGEFECSPIQITPSDFSSLEYINLDISRFEYEHIRHLFDLFNLFRAPNLKNIIIKIPKNYAGLIDACLSGLSANRINIDYGPRELKRDNTLLQPNMAVGFKHANFKHKDFNPKDFSSKELQPKINTTQTESKNIKTPSDLFPSQTQDRVDCDTSDNNPTMVANNFLGLISGGKPSISQVRGHVQTVLKVSEKTIEFPNVPAPDLTPVRCAAISQEEFNQQAKKSGDIPKRFVVIPAPLEPGFDTPVPLLYRNDIIQAMVPHPHVDLYHSKERGQYFLKLKKDITAPQMLDLSFQVQYNPPEEFKWAKPNPAYLETLQHVHFTLDEGKLELKADPHWEAKLEQLKKADILDQLTTFYYFCKELKVGELSKKVDGLKGINAVLHEMKGVCRHRSVLFKGLSDTCIPPPSFGNPSPVNIILNDIHAFIEISYGGQYYNTDLGGGRARVNVLPPPDLPEIKAPTNTFSRFVTHLFTEAKAVHAFKHDPNILLYLPSQTALLRYQAEQRVEMKEQKRNYFYIDDLDNVPDGVDDFIRNAKPGDVLSVNCTKSQPMMINPLLDKNMRKLRSLPIPEGVIIVGLVNQAKHEAGEDFESRFPISEDVPPELPLKEDIFFGRCLEKIPADNKAERLDFRGIKSWQNHCHPHLKFEGTRSQTMPSVLDQFAKNADTLEFVKAPWGNPEFDLFISNWLYEHPDKKIVKKEEQYVFKHEYKSEPFSKINAQAWQYPLNPAMLPHFFSGYEEHKGKLIPSTGILDQHPSGRPMTLLVTAPLDDPDHWSQLMLAAEQKNIALQFITTPGITLPPIITEQKKKAVTETSHKKETITPPSTSPISVIYTNDVDYTIEMQIKEKVDHTIHITKTMNFQDVWESLSVTHINTQTMEFEASYRLSQIWDWLADGKTVVLEGQFSDDLAGQMESLFASPPYLRLNGRTHVFPNGKLILVTDEKNRFVAATEQAVTHHVVPSNRWQALSQNSSANNDLTELETLLGKKAETMTYAQLKTAAKEQPYRHPLYSSALASIQPREELNKLPFHKHKHHETKENDFIQQRLTEMAEILNYSPCLCLIGPAGTGKSTTVLESLATYYQDVKQTEIKLYSGMDSVSSWAKEKRDNKLHILFIDEATLQKSGNFDLFEGLYRKPPGIFIDQKFHPLAPNQKVIFATNFGRQQHKFFESRGGMMLFDELPKPYLKTRFIDPGLEKAIPALTSTQRESLSNIFLLAYDILKTFNPNELLSIRNFQAMCLHAAVLMPRLSEIFNNDIHLLAAFVGMEAIKPFLKNSTQHQEAENQFKLTDYKLQQTRLAELSAKQFKSDQYILTPSRFGATRIFSEELEARQKKIDNPELAMMGQRGLFIEGPSGVGKSAFVIQTLKLNGFVDVDDKSLSKEALEKAKRERKCFREIATTHPDEMEEKLVESFHAGYVVIANELNTMPHGEALRTLLAGRDANGERAKQEGFFVIGTGNPPHFAHRQPLADELRNRLKEVKLDHYPAEELKSILTNQTGITSDQADTLIHKHKALEKKRGRPVPIRRLFLQAARLAEEMKEKRTPSANT